MAGTTSSLSEYSKAQLSANTTLSQNLNNASNVYTGISQAADSDIDGLLKSAFNALRSTGFDGVTGLETSKVAAMKASITKYVQDVEAALAPLNQSDATKAFGNTIAPKIQEFVVSVKKSCGALISNMESFNADLDAIKTAMEAKATQVNTAVGNQASSLDSGSKSWTYSGSNESN